jgi:hypothetical protein
MSAWSAETTAREAARSKPIRLLSRVGLVAYGLVHVLVAFLAIRVAIGDPASEKSDKGGALQTLADQPGGELMLWLIAVGLAALTIWKVAEVIWGHRAVLGRLRRWVRRATSVGEAAVFGFLAVSAAVVAARGGSTGGGDEQALTARVLAMPFGFLLVGAVGVGVVCVSAFLVYRGWKRKFTRNLDFTGVSPTAMRTAIRLGQFGHAGLGVAYGTVGVLVVVAAATNDPARPVGLDAALKTLADQPYGKLLLAVVAAGLACFGLYCVLDARYRED